MDEGGWETCPDDTFVGMIGPVLRRVRDGLEEFGLQTDARHRNLSGIVHGGVVMTLLDRTLGKNSRDAGGGRRMATASLTVNFLRPVRVGDFLHTRCRLRREGRKSVFADAEAYVGDRLVATATGICMTVG